jgi:sporulation protein YlmC with PRC-barrel domain
LPAAGLALAAPAFGTSETSTSQQSAMQQKSAGAQASEKQNAENYRGMRASELIGQDVKSPQGKNLGEISDLIIDMNSEKVRYAILAFDPGIFSGERLFAVPTTELKWGKEKNEIVYDMKRERLEKASVEKSRWPDAARDRDYLGNLDRAYGIAQPSQNRRAFRAGELLGKDVNGRQGEEIGEIRDLVIDMNAQRVHYAVLSFDPGWTAPEKLYAFPLTAFRFTDGKDELALDIDKSRLQAMRSFDQKLWATYATPVFVTDVDRYLVTVTPLKEGGANAQPSSAAQNKAAPSQGGSATAQGSAAAKDKSSPTQSGSTMQQGGSSNTPGKSSMAIGKSSLAASGQGAGSSSGSQAANTAASNPDSGASGQSGMSTSASSNAAKADTSAAATETGAGGTVVTTSPEYTASMKRLQESAQKLRESIQAMAQHPPGERRDQAMKEARQALYDTHQAMIQLPPRMRSNEPPSTVAGATGKTGSSGAGSAGTASSMSDAEYSRSMERLQKSAQEVREAIQAMAQQPQGQRRDQAIMEAHEALMDLNQSMAQLPPDLLSKN